MLKFDINFAYIFVYQNKTNYLFFFCYKQNKIIIYPILVY